MKPILTQNQNKPKQVDKYEILKNKEIIIYKNGEEFKHFRQSETKELNEDELCILDYLLKKYSEFEVPLHFSKIEKENDFEFESTEDFFKKKQEKRPIEISEEEDRKTEPKLKEYFKDIEDFGDISKKGTTEIKKLRKAIVTKEDQKVPIKRKKQELSYQYEVENVDIDNEEEEESEEPPQYVIEAESYTSPTFKDVDENYAEEALLNGIKISLMLNGQEKKGIIFLGENEKLIFVCFEDKKETIINLNNIKRIYFNIKGSSNLRNYKNKGNNERFIQFVDLNNITKTDFKFNTNNDLEYFIKGLIQTFHNKSNVIDKNIIYEKIKKYDIDIFSKNDLYINDICNNLNIAKIDLSIKNRRKYFNYDYYEKEIICTDKNCEIKSIENINFTGTCQCKINFDYTTFKNTKISILNAIDEIKSDDISLIIFKCFKTGFNKSITSNTGFYLFLIFIVFQVCFFIIFILFGNKRLFSPKKKSISNPPFRRRDDYLFIENYDIIEDTTNIKNFESKQKDIQEKDDLEEDFVESKCDYDISENNYDKNSQNTKLEDIINSTKREEKRNSYRYKNENEKSSNTKDGLMEKNEDDDKMSKNELLTKRNYYKKINTKYNLKSPILKIIF